MHPQRMILFFDVRSRNQIHVGRTLHNCLFGFDDFRRTIPTRRIFVEVDDGVGFYNLPIIGICAKAVFNRFPICEKRIG